MNKLDERGKQCPLPVIEAKKELETYAEGEQLLVVVDNEIAVQNLQKMANQKGYGFAAKTISPVEYEVTLTAAGSAGETGAPESTEEYEDCVIVRKKKKVVVIESDGVGEPIRELGQILMKGFIYALSRQEEVPQCVLFLNGGAKLTCEGSESIEDLQLLEQNGCEIMTCGTCLDFQNLKEKLKVGTVTNMYEIAERMMQADLVVRP